MQLEYLLTDIQELSFKKNVTAGQNQINLQVKTDYSIYYSDDESACIADFIAMFTSSNNPDEFQIRYHSKSLFKIDDVVLDENAKKEIHVEIYQRIYPMCKETIKNFSATIGVSNISLPQINVSKDTVIVRS